MIFATSGLAGTKSPSTWRLHSGQIGNDQLLPQTLLDALEKSVALDSWTGQDLREPLRKQDLLGIV